MTRRVLALVFVAITLAACGSDDAAAVPTVLLDGSPRHSDVAGRLTDVAEDFSTVTIDNTDFDLATEIVSFAAIDGGLHPLIQWVNQYVQAGLVDGEIVWVGGVGAVVDLPDEPEVVYFTDVLVAVDASKAMFRSGTVLPVADDAIIPDEVPVAVVVTIDVASDEIVAFEPG